MCHDSKSCIGDAINMVNIKNAQLKITKIIPPQTPAPLSPQAAETPAQFPLLPHQQANVSQLLQVAPQFAGRSIFYFSHRLRYP